MASSSDCAARSATGWPSSGARTRPSACRRCRPRTSASSRAQSSRRCSNRTRAARSPLAACRRTPSKRKSSPRPFTRRCSASAASSRCSRTSSSRTLTSTAVTDDELVELIQVLAAYSGLSSRPFDTANPQLDLRLPDGSRLSAVMDVTLRPAVSIRRARLGKVFLADLVGNGTLLPETASFLAAATAARKNIMIAGATNAGKTTLLRAMVNQIPGDERLITVERALEVGIDQFPELHPNVVAFEERLPNSEG